MIKPHHGLMSRYNNTHIDIDQDVDDQEDTLNDD